MHAVLIDGELNFAVYQGAFVPPGTPLHELYMYVALARCQFYHGFVQVPQVRNNNTHGPEMPLQFKFRQYHRCWLLSAALYYS